MKISSHSAPSLRLFYRLQIFKKWKNNKHEKRELLESLEEWVGWSIGWWSNDIWINRWLMIRLVHGWINECLLDIFMDGWLVDCLCVDSWMGNWFMDEWRDLWMTWINDSCRFMNGFFEFYEWIHIYMDWLCDSWMCSPFRGESDSWLHPIHGCV